MKNILTISIIFLFVTAFAGCKESSSDEEAIKDRIAALQTSLNNDDYTAFQTNFDPTCSLEFGSTYNSSDFHTLTGNGTITFSFSGITVSGSDATCVDTRTTSGISGTHTESFSFIMHGDDALIYTWDDGSIPVFYKKK